MKTTLQLLIGGIAAALFSGASFAQVGMAGDCTKARDPARCEALQKAKETCKDKAPADKSKCMMESMPPMDCSKARNPERCEAMEKAKVECKDRNGPEYRQCLREHAPRRAKRQAAPKN
ncbi:MAG: hypothetical protein ACM3Y9_17025 [Ignavibacteria bacterium]